MNISYQKIVRSIVFRICSVFLLLFLSGQNVSSQEIRISCTDRPLNLILTDMRDNYGVMVSFDDNRLSAYKLTVEKKFSSARQALDYLFRGLPLGYDDNDGIFVIYPIVPSKVQKTYTISGKITDITNHEVLSFSAVQINNKGFYSDEEGNFSMVSRSDSVFSIKISHLGYYILDTIVKSANHYIFRLTPSVVEMKEVIVKGETVSKTIQTGNAPGIIKLNHKIAYFLPGNGDNSVFNLLRLQPGILAAGDQSNDLLIWGGYDGQSQVLFDEFTLYGLKNFNDNISAVNPFMAKDIKVLKGGFGAEYGEKSGAIIDISGTDGNLLAPSFLLSINNMTVNGMISVPFHKRSSLLMAYRQTYYDLYNPVGFTSTGGYGRGRQSGTGADYYIVPEYIFRDANIKYSFKGTNSNFQLSMYAGGDDFGYGFDNEEAGIQTDYGENNLQYGASAKLSFKWKEKNTSDFILSYSGLNSDRTFSETTVQQTGGNGGGYQGGTLKTVNGRYLNSIYEMNGRLESKLFLSENHVMDAGIGVIDYYTDNHLNIIRDTVKTDLLIPYLYLQDNISLGSSITVTPGLRTDYHTVMGKLYLQPRFSSTYRIKDFFRVNASAGRYNQFTTKNMILDPSGDYILAWSLTGEKLNVTDARTYTLGFAYDRKNFTINIEGYLKYTADITRFIQDSGTSGTYHGKSRTKGLDFFIKKEFGQQSVWIAYTLSKTEEYFPYFTEEIYVPAMHDQRHELKFAGLFKLGPFHFSANYVYGSGIPDPALLPSSAVYERPYSRMDADIIFSRAFRKISLEAGFSILNIFNTENIKYSNYTRISTGDTSDISLYAEAVPFTPTLFLKISY